MLPVLSSLTMLPVLSVLTMLPVLVGLTMLPVLSGLTMLPVLSGLTPLPVLSGLCHVTGVVQSHHVTRVVRSHNVTGVVRPCQQDRKFVTDVPFNGQPQRPAGSSPDRSRSPSPSHQLLPSCCRRQRSRHLKKEAKQVRGRKRRPCTLQTGKYKRQLERFLQVNYVTESMCVRYHSSVSH